MPAMAAEAAVLHRHQRRRQGGRQVAQPHRLAIQVALGRQHGAVRRQQGDGGAAGGGGDAIHPRQVPGEEQQQQAQRDAAPDQPLHQPAQQGPATAARRPGGIGPRGEATGAGRGDRGAAGAAGRRARAGWAGGMCAASIAGAGGAVQGCRTRPAASLALWFTHMSAAGRGGTRKAVRSLNGWNDPRRFAATPAPLTGRARRTRPCWTVPRKAEPETGARPPGARGPEDSGPDTRPRHPGGGRRSPSCRRTGCCCWRTWPRTAAGRWSPAPGRRRTRWIPAC